MYRTRAIGLVISRQCIHQVPPTMRAAALAAPTVHMRNLSEQSWAQKISSFFYGKDDNNSSSEKGKDAKDWMGDDSGTLNLESYFKHMDKLTTMKKLGLGSALEKIVGVNLDTTHEKLIENHKKIKDFLTENELQGSSFSLSPQRKSELQSSTGLSAQDIDQITSMFSHIQQVKKVFDKAKSEGKIPQSMDELKEMIGGVINAAQGQGQGQSSSNQGSNQNQSSSPFNTQRGTYGSNEYSQTSSGSQSGQSSYGSVGSSYSHPSSSHGSGTSSSTSYGQGSYTGSPPGQGYQGSQGGQVGHSQGNYTHDRFPEGSQGQSQGGQSFPSGYQGEKKVNHNDKVGSSQGENKNSSGSGSMGERGQSETKGYPGENKANVGERGYGDSKNKGENKSSVGENKGYGENKDLGENKDKGDSKKGFGDNNDYPGYQPSSKSDKSKFGDNVDDKGGYGGFGDKTSPQPNTSSYTSQNENKGFGVGDTKNSPSSSSSSTTSSSKGHSSSSSQGPFTGQSTTTQTRKITQASSTVSAAYGQQIPIHRFNPVPKKDKAVIGRNDVVRITNGTETQEMKFKKAESLIATGRWKLVDNL